MKQRLTTAPILGHPDFSKPFIVMTDASKNGLGAILTQKDEFNREVVIRYASRATTGTERNYAATQLEQLGVVWAVKYFRKYLLGQPFQIYTDHQAITRLMSTKEPTGITARWIMILQEYKPFEVIYRPGKNHSNVDTLSRTLYQ